ncbi:MAG: protein kinase [Gammaproteobacteria bacterium]|jgi:serine/threonine protein kinase
MAIAPGTHFNSYEVIEPIGSGGMGEVYRATDTNLRRDVALKVLAENRNLDPEASVRFEREARLLAALNHPNIATLHGFETSGDAQALVMELVEGEGLDERIDRSPGGMPLGEVLEIAKQIATALDAAHQRGIVHRDLKPANIRIRPDGTVKVLDFGIAKAFATEGTPGTASTVTQMPGAIIGTPSYMSPEQASGDEVDRRTDVWAFACVLFEMLTGQRVFDGDTNSRVLARVLERDPDWSLLPPSVPPRIRTLLEQCLVKDPRRRRQDAGDLRLDLDLASSEPDDAILERRESAGQRTAWLAGAILVGALAGALALYLADRPEPLRQSVWDIATPTTRQPHEFALSPDGTFVAFVASKSPDTIEQVLYLRNIETGAEEIIPNTEGARLPCWSPDSQSIAYFAREYLHRIAIDGGGSQRLAPALNGFGCSWGTNGRILFTPSTVTGLYSVPESGGEHQPVTQINLAPAPGDPTYETNHRYPTFIDGTDRFLYFATGGSDVAGIYLGSFDGGQPTRLIASDSAGAFVAPDSVVYVQNGRLVVRQLDLDQRQLTGETEVLAESITNPGGGQLAFSASRNGDRFIYRSTPAPPLRLTVFDRSGNVLSVESEPRNGPEVSDDDLVLGYDNPGSGSRDVYVANLDGTGGVRITGDATVEGYPDFSPDRRSLVYEKQRPDDKFFELWRVEINRADEARHLYDEADAERNLIPLDWSTNDYILFRRSDRDFLASDLIALSLSEPKPQPIEIAVSEFEERMGQVSPDGDWVVYDSNQPGQGRFGVFVQTFPNNESGSRPVTNDGFAPRWNADGTEIYFLTLDGRVMAAPVSRSGSDIDIGAPVALFRAELQGPSFNHQYAVTSEGRFLINVIDVDDSPPPIKVVQNSSAFESQD